MSKHGYLLMAHGQFEQLKKLILLLDDPRNDIYVHVDAKSRDFNQDQFVNLTKKAGLSFIKRKRVTWGAYSQVRCELELLEAATKEYHDYYHLLSGSDLPIKSQDQIHAFYETNQGTEFLNMHEGVMEKKGYRDRIQIYHFLQEQIGNKKSDSLVFKVEWGLLKLQELLHVDRLKKYNLVFQKGTNWFSITHELAQYTVSEAPRIRQMYKFTKCADEVFLHTLAWNSQFRNRIQSDSKRLIDWKRGRPYTFRLDDFEALMSSSCFWARKFNEEIDSDIVGKIFDALYVTR
jgi:hypothetical protein